MRFLFYTHSLLSDWNHGNAHFLRGVMRELQRLGHQTIALEPHDSWSRTNLVTDQGPEAESRFAEDFPELTSRRYGPAFDHEEAVNDADVVVVHEWTQPALVAHLGQIRRHVPVTLLFHDTHHRTVSARDEIASLMLADYDAVLAFGETLRQRYLRQGWGGQVFTWHEAADLALFHPIPEIARTEDLIWVGNWGDDERSAEIESFLIAPAQALGLSGTVRGVRYPDTARRAIESAGLRHRGWIANADVPAAFAAHRVTVHIPRRPYVEALPGIPTIRVFEALAAGIPLVSAPWSDVEGLFRPGLDFLFAADRDMMVRHLRDILADRGMAAALVRSGLETIRGRHSCAHRAGELLAILQRLGNVAAAPETVA